MQISSEPDLLLMPRKEAILLSPLVTLPISASGNVRHPSFVSIVTRDGSYSKGRAITSFRLSRAYPPACWAAEAIVRCSGASRRFAVRLYCLLQVSVSTLGHTAIRLGKRTLAIIKPRHGKFIGVAVAVVGRVPLFAAAQHDL